MLVVACHDQRLVLWGNMACDRAPNFGAAAHAAVRVLRGSSSEMH